MGWVLKPPRARTENHFRHELYLDLNSQNLVHAVRRKILREPSASGCFSLYSLPRPLACFFSSFEGCAAELEAKGDITVRCGGWRSRDFKIVLYFCSGNDVRLASLITLKGKRAGLAY